MAKNNRSAGGIGESRIHANPAAFDPQPTRHVDGRPVGTGKLDHLLAGRYTDEGMAEVDAKPKARSSVLSDEFDKQTFQARRDFRENELEPWMAPDPMGDLVKAHCPEGHKPRFLSNSKVTRDGLRGWKPVVSTNGDPVKLGNMVLASMPIEMAERRNRFFQDKSKDRITQIYNNQVEQLSQNGLKAIDTNAQRGEGGLERTVGNTSALE